MLKKITLLSVLSTLTYIGTSTANANTLSELNKCSVVKDSLERLVCYDELVKKVNLGSLPQPRAQQKSSSSVPASINTVNTKKSVVDDFGKEHIRNRVEPDVVDNVNFVIAKVEKNKSGKWLITFVNGQQWKQIDSTTLRLKAGQEVELKKGVLGAFFLKRLDAKKRLRVKRLK
ncbi:hypothetical protein J7384_06335 [Endozoicomonas sp. G2_1]|uniref:hypothetical protein n=1 Tax=Endozoicomonas sp. G2_1 TaxID=2821091 RepID=UPI001ADC6AA1|nr:hypothetical protein [Endozoicomonas sp. G2_1]MBO9489975.1 hypothetical protein [Endozoicomonas sp. G2_1]